jgi:aspartokinase/homoserine dehydrogenase 1
MEALLADGLALPSPAENQRLHYIGRIEAGRIDIGIQVVPESSPFARLEGSDNLIVFTTKRYFTNPLVIRGPGAGPAVTAGGVLADLIRAAELVT